MPTNWPHTQVLSASELLNALRDLQHKGWAFRGQPKVYPALLPSIERGGRLAMSRAEKLELERQSITVFRKSAKYFAHPGEQLAMTDDIIALKVLQHYGTPTRLLDWTKSPEVAAYFAAESHPGERAEIWAFNEPLYEREGLKQWDKWPETTEIGPAGNREFNPHLTAFRAAEPPDWFICVFYLNPGFPRQIEQAALSSMTARFAQDHAEHIERLLPRPAERHRFEFSPELKPQLLRVLQESAGVWRGKLVPDSAGAAETAGQVFRASSPAQSSPHPH